MNSHPSSFLAALPILGWVFAVVLVALAVFCIVAGQGSVKRNPIIGIRIPSLFASDEAWRAGHAAGVVPAVVCAAVALVADLVGFAEPWLRLISVIAFVVGLIWTLTAASRAARAAA